MLSTSVFELLQASRFRSLLNEYVFYTNTDPEKERDFQAYSRKNTIRMLYPILSVLILFTILFWPTDFFVLNNRADVFWTFVVWRSLLVTEAILLFIGLKFFEILRRHVHLIIVGVICVTCLIVSYSFGRLGGLEQPWFWFIYFIPWLTIFLALEPIKRFLSTAGIMFSWAGGYLVPFPEHLEYSLIGVPLVLSFALIFMITLAGHVLYHFFRKDYFNQRKLEYLARHDRLTGLLNRRFFGERLQEEFERSGRYETDLSALMMDLDHFKKINDTHGHPAGDRVLEAVGEIIQSETREPDIKARFGGEEFIVLMPETNLEDAKSTAQRLKQNLNQRTFTDETGDTFSVTCSIGLASKDPEMNDPEELVKKVDRALYEAKETGRDKIVKLD